MKNVQNQIISANTLKNIVCVYIPKKRKNYLFQADIDKYYVQKNEKT